MLLYCLQNYMGVFLLIALFLAMFIFVGVKDGWTTTLKMLITTLIIAGLVFLTAYLINYKCC